VSEMLDRGPRVRHSHQERPSSAQAGRFTLCRWLSIVSGILLALASASIVSAACRPDPYIDHEFERAVRIPLPGRLPTEISDGHHIFSVQMAKATSMPHFNGVTNYDARVILLADDLSADQERETFYHELSHVAARLKESIYDGCKRRNEDQAIELISPGMVELLRKNPGVLDYLLAK
jgi:hypothetical protein